MPKVTRKTTDGARSYFPIGLDLNESDVLVFGGARGSIAEVSRLLEFGARVHVIAPRVAAEVQALATIRVGQLSIVQRHLTDEDLGKVQAGYYALVFAFGKLHEDILRLESAAQKAGVPFFAENGAGARSNFVMSTVLKRGHLKVAVSTDGISKAVEQSLIRQIESHLLADLDRYSVFLHTVVDKMVALANEDHYSALTKQAIEKRVAESEELLSALDRHNFEDAERILEHICAEESEAAALTSPN